MTPECNGGASGFEQRNIESRAACLPAMFCRGSTWANNEGSELQVDGWHCRDGGSQESASVMYLGDIGELDSCDGFGRVYGVKTDQKFFRRNNFVKSFISKKFLF